ncbi:MAG: response regulator [Dysgonamonadaceae bacterium]|jgi:CheY-like chemotaxis protein|nr:response regulator [Dysgonamonadaceae bacterium]
MNKLLIIENNETHFDEIKKVFEDWNVLPVNHKDISSYSNKDAVVSYINNSIKESNISAIIMDISLQASDNDDETGLEIIELIRAVDDDKNKTIPIYCYSQHGKSDSMRSKAFKMGATNIFSKASMNVSDEVIFLKQSLTALAIIYTSVRDKGGLSIEDINKQFITIIEKLNSIKGQNNVLQQSIIKLLSLDDITSITELSDENYNQIVEAIGGESSWQALKEEKFFKENREGNIALVDDVANILSDIVALAPIAAILKVFTMLAKRIK